MHGPQLEAARLASLHVGVEPPKVADAVAVARVGRVVGYAAIPADGHADCGGDDGDDGVPEKALECATTRKAVAAAALVAGAVACSYAVGARDKQELEV
jgi:hypothetical protein